MVRPDDDGGGSPVLEIRVPSVTEAGRVLGEIGQAVDATLGSTRRKAEDAIPAFPPSDLQRSYIYCWGRWSQLLQAATHRLAWAGAATIRAAENYADSDRLGGNRNVPR